MSIKAIITVLFTVCLSICGYAQTFESPFEDETMPDGTFFTYSGRYAYDGYAEKWEERDNWASVGVNEARRTTEVLDGNQWVFISSSHYIDGRFASQLYDTGDFTISTYIRSQVTEPETIKLGEYYSGSTNTEEWASILDIYFSTTKTNYTERLEAIEIIDLSFGQFPAYRFRSTISRTSTYNPEYGYEPESSQYSFTYWMIPGLGFVRADYSDPAYDYIDIYELTEINFEFDPEPLPILDSDNPVWNALGYTWEIGNGWQYSYEFGSVWTSNWPFAWIDSLQSWAYVEGNRHSLWLWHYARNSWVWTSQAMWPWYYAQKEGKWLYAK